MARPRQSSMEDLPQDQPEPDVAADFEDMVADPVMAVDAEIVAEAAKEWNGALAALSGASDELHAIHMRLAEIRPFLASAIEKAEGDVKVFLQTLSDGL